METMHVPDVQGQKRIPSSSPHQAPVLWPWILVIVAWTVALVAALTNQNYLIDHHLRSDFDAQMQTDEATRSFSTGWHFRGDRADISDEYIKVSRSVPYAAGWPQLLRLVWGDACQKHTHG